MIAIGYASSVAFSVSENRAGQLFAGGININTILVQGIDFIHLLPVLVHSEGTLQGYAVLDEITICVHLDSHFTGLIQLH